MRGQYRGYVDETGVDAGSDVETYVALRFEIDSWRWAGVPFLIRAGKHLPVTATEAVVEFNAPPRLLFSPPGHRRPHPNHLRFQLGKDDGVMLHLQTKAPGDDLVSRPVDLEVRFDEVFGAGPRPTSGSSRTPSRATTAASAGPTPSRSSGGSSNAMLAAPHPVSLYQGTWGPTAAEAPTGSASVGGWHEPL